MSALEGTGANGILGRLEAQSGRPLRAMIEISDRCNEVCVHCYQVQGQKGEMTTEQIFGVIDELADLGILVLTISGGEATLRKDFLPIVAHARRRGFLVRVFTNGLTMSRELAQALGAQAVQTVEVSLYSHRAEIHDFVTGVAGSFERTVRGIEFLRDAGVGIHVKTPLMSVNEGEIGAYIDFVESLGASYALDPHQMSPREGRDLAPAPFSVGGDALRELLADERVLGMPLREQPQRASDAPLCGVGESLVIEPNGELRPCTALEVGLGHALEGGVGASRASNELLAGMQGLRWRDVHGCRECQLNGYCARCHATALAEAGDALGPYRSGCTHARSVYGAALGREVRVLGDDASALGPYRVEAGGVRPVPDVVTAADDALAERLGWVRAPRTGGGDACEGPRAVPGALVQLRRPGQKRPRPTRVPGVAPAPADARPDDASYPRHSTPRAHARPLEERP